MSERNHEITKRQDLLDEKGRLREPGWSRSLLQTYSRKAIKAPGFRIKEWDYYLVQGDNFYVAFTISDLGYLAMVSVSYINLKRKRETTRTEIKPLTMGSVGLFEDSAQEGKISFHGKKIHLEYQVKGKMRRIRSTVKNFVDGKHFTCDIALTMQDMDTMVIGIPWDEDPKAFYYNQKINCMPAGGWIKFGTHVKSFYPERNFGTLDWGRGVWTYKNTWYWGTGNGLVNQKPFGFNLGYGFGNSKAATENIIYYDGKTTKLDEIEFLMPMNLMKPWKITSSDGRIEMEFVPTIDRAAHTKALVIETIQDQYFGKLYGTVVLEDGTVLEISDFYCAIEKVTNKY